MTTSPGIWPGVCSLMRGNLISPAAAAAAAAAAEGETRHGPHARKTGSSHIVVVAARASLIVAAHIPQGEKKTLRLESIGLSVRALGEKALRARGDRRARR